MDLWIDQEGHLPVKSGCRRNRSSGEKLKELGEGAEEKRGRSLGCAGVGQENEEEE